MPTKRKNRTTGSSEGRPVRSLRSNSDTAVSVPDLPVFVASNANDDDAPNQLTAPVVSTVRRLLIEDIMTLPANLAKPFVLCFNESAPNFQTLHNAMSQQSSRLPMLFFEAHRFFQIRVTVDLNGRVGNMVDGVLSRPDFLHLMFGNGNEQISFLLYPNDPLCRSAPVTACSFTFLWRDFFEHKLSLLLFGNVPFRRQFYEALHNLSAFDSRITLFRQLADEVRFDCSLSFELCHAYERVITQSAKGNGKSDAGSFKSLLDKGLTGDALTELELEVNTTICAEVLLCYGSFCSWTDSVLPDAVLDRLVQRAFDLVPHLINVIMYMLGTLQQENVKRKRHLLVYYRRTAFFELMALARLRNRQRFIWWSVINTAIYYQADAQSLVSNVTKLFGITCTFCTLMEKTLPMTEEASFRLRVLEALNDEVVDVSFAPAAGVDDPTPVRQRFKFVIMVFDNTQKNYPLKWQRGGRTSYFLKLTSRMFWKVTQGPWKTLVVPQQHVPLTYVEQVIPSAFGMPPWEVFDISTHLTDLLVSPHQLELPPNLLSPPATIDFTGKRVCAHEQLVFYAASCRSLYRHLSLAKEKAYEFRPSVMSSSPTVALVSERLSKCRGVGGLLRTSPSFQQRMVSVYRPSTPKLELLVLPVLKFDETTRLGMANVVVQLLKDACLLVASGNPDSAMPDWVVPADIHERYLLVAGDGLSHERWRSYKKELLDLQEKGMKYAQHYLVCSEVIKALERCILVPGDLHASLFHTLGPIYTVFYGAFIQPFQIALGWKHIDWQKVERTYQQSSILALSILVRVEVRLMESFVNSLDETEVTGLCTRHDDGAFLIAFLVTGFEKWIVSKLENTTDKWFRLVLNFFVQSRDYRTVRESIRNGDTVMLEVLHQRFTYIWCAVKKPKCFENGLATTEELYAAVPFWVLQIIRDNRTARLYDGKDLYSGRPTAHRAMDECMEIVQHKYKCMNFPGNEDSFYRHSFNMSFAHKAGTFGYHQYSYRYDVESVDDYNSGQSKGDCDKSDQGRKKKATVVPKRTMEKKLIDEILTLSGVMVEEAARELDPNRLWKVLPETTTVLVLDKRGSTSDTLENDDENEEGLANSGIASDLEELRIRVRATRPDNIGRVEASESMDHVDKVALSTAMIDDAADVVDAEVDEQGLADDSGPGSNETETVEAGIEETATEEEVMVGKNSRKVKKVALSPLSTVDLHEMGRAKMMSMDLPARRYRRKMREERERKALHQNLFEFMNGLTSETGMLMNELEDGSKSTELRSRFDIAKQLRNT